MGILLSFLFPYRYMYAEQPVSSPSSSSSTSSSSTDGESNLELLGLSPLLDSPAAADQVAPLSSPDDANLDNSSPLAVPDTRSFSRHVLGLGLSSFRTSLSPPSSLPLIRGSAVPPEAESASQNMPRDLFEAPSQASGASPPGSPPSRSGRLLDDLESFAPPSPSLSHMEASAAHSSFFPSSESGAEQRAVAAGGGGGASGPSLRLEIPPPPHHPGNPFVHSGPAFSPPPLASSAASPHQQEPPMLAASSQGSHAALDLAQEMPFGLNATAVASDTALNLDFAEFDLEGLSTLEKIYLFSRSRASFQRVFIAHALPGYLRSALRRHGDVAASGPAGTYGQSEAASEPDEIAPAEAVEYVLPLLNGLAMDDDEAVKEALAAELVPIIWWFITHCRLVDEEPAPAFDAATGATNDEPTQVSVQAFTPILGTLLLSPNGLVGGPARYAVVELLSRVRRADAKDANESSQQTMPSDPSPGLVVNREEDRGGTGACMVTAEEAGSEDDYSPIGLFGAAERRLFEREMVHQVVIGMGRLDLPEESTFGGELLEDQHIPDTTAIPTPHASLLNRTHDNDSYFPPMESIPDASETDSTDNTPFTGVTESSSPSSMPPSDSGSPSSLPSLTSTASSTNSTPASTMATLAPSPTPSSVSQDARKHSSTLGSPIRMPLQLDFVDDWRPMTTARPLSPRSISPGQIVARSASPRPVSPAILALARTSPHLSSPGPLSPRPLSPRPRSPHLASTVLQPYAQPPSSLAEELHIERSPSPLPDIVSPVPAPAPGLLHPAFAEGGDMGGLAGTPPEEYTDEIAEEAQLNEEASVGRLSSMSLMAAVTASGPIDAETKSAFVAEVERVGRDPVYWVRREASFAVGALAKVVPQEVVLVTLLPLFEELYRDPVWHVRHSALFALPAVLSRLPPQHRRTLALDVIPTLANDESMTVRSGVLEALAEVIYTFHEDAERPPDKLLRLFLGVREDDDPRKEEPEDEKAPSSPASSLSWNDFITSVSSGTNDGPEADIYDDPSRPLVCAFNLPAVALTVGRDRWSELRELYHTLSRTSSFKIRRTLAASLGELAKIIGPEQAHSDLMPVWWASIRSDEGDVRLRALEGSEAFVNAIGTEDRKEVMSGLEERVWPLLKGWRERESLMKSLPALAAVEGVDEKLVWRLLRKGLVDSAATVREMSVSTLPALLMLWMPRVEVVKTAWNDVLSFARSTSYRQRMTFIACQQVILQSDLRIRDFLDEAFFQTISTLAEDSIVDVRIRVARLLGAFRDGSDGLPHEASRTLYELAKKLSQDPSSDVKSFSEPLVASWPPTVPPRRRAPGESAKNTANFSRPPPSPAM